MNSVIYFRDVSFKYSNSEQFALKDINLNINKGEFVLITGPSGCGKSTLCRIINGLIPHFYGGTLTGEAIVLGYDVSRTPTYVLARYVGMVFQNPENQLFLSSVEKELAFGLENLSIPKPEIEKRVQEVAQLMNIETLLDKAPYELSGGQQQKVAIASVLVMYPKILVLDEPTSNLDPRSAMEIIDLIFRLNKKFGITVIIIEHRLELVLEKTTRLIFINKGRIIYDGDPRKILKKEDIDELEFYLPKSVKLYRDLKRIGIELPDVPLSPSELATVLRGELKRRRLLK
ncbi:MAG: ABC transporter ATP-binding protein [Thermoprotei archaeon]|nr:MAG: ABC transporter ATP-binding protein [Thermoprotei archaeon]RLI91462.1 MAG: ABC transporter ATP-binding protein [Candidatus Altiarchaeales archaeon]HDD63858.1 ABC transporter ATP-binding protein [Thermoprotei archaeon]